MTSRDPHLGTSLFPPLLPGGKAADTIVALYRLPWRDHAPCSYARVPLRVHPGAAVKKCSDEPEQECTSRTARRPLPIVLGHRTGRREGDLAPQFDDAWIRLRHGKAGALGCLRVCPSWASVDELTAGGGCLDTPKVSLRDRAYQAPDLWACAGARACAGGAWSPRVERGSIPPACP